MKTLQSLALVSALSVGLSLSAYAVTNTGGLLDVAKLDGTPVVDKSGKDIGKIHQVLVDPHGGMIRYGVVEVDKAWSLENPEVAVPWGAFQMSGSGKDMKLSLDATKEKLQNAPKTKVGEADQLYTPEAAKPLYDYWSIYWYDIPMAGDQPAASTTAGQKNKSASPAAPASRPASGTTGSNAGATKTQ